MRKLAVLLVFTIAACTASPPGSDDTETEADAGTEVVVVDGDVRLEAETPPSSTMWRSVPITGYGPSGGKIVIVSPEFGADFVELRSDGAFCYNFPLSQGQLNEITLTAMNDEGESSESISFSVLQDGEPPKIEITTPSSNAMKQGEYSDYSSFDLIEGDLAALFDEDPTSGPLLENDKEVFDDDWMIVRPPQPTLVNKIRLSSDPACPLTEYQLYVSLNANEGQSAPSGEDANNGSWIFVANHDLDWIGGVGEGGLIVPIILDETVTMPSGEWEDCSTSEMFCEEYRFDPVEVGSISIVVNDEHCTASWTGFGQHHVTEIEAWTPQTGELVEESGPSCASGGF